MTPFPRPIPETETWLLLLALTGATYAAGEAGWTGPGAVAALLVLALAKGRLVAWHYMGLAGTRSLWRWLVGGWLAGVGGLIATAFWIASN